MNTFLGMLKTAGIAETDLNGDAGIHALKTALLDLGLKVYPTLDGVGFEGYVRIIRSGSLLGAILTNLETPGPGSDRDLAALLNELKRRRDEGDPQ